MSAETYKLKDGVTIFYDDVTELKVVNGETIEIDEAQAASAKTAVALQNGVLVKVKKTTKKGEGSEVKQ